MKEHSNWSEEICISVSFLGCHNKLSQTCQLKTIEAYSFTVLGAGNLKLRCWQNHVSSEGFREESSLAFL